MAINTLVVQKGLDYILSAHDLGVLLAIKYFVPVYDYRIDPLFHDEVNTLTSSTTDIATSAYALTATSPYGEIIWNRGSSYSLSDSFILSSGNVTPDSIGATNTITDSIQSKKTSFNTYSGVPLSDSYSGSTISYNSSNGTWTVETFDKIVGSNIQPASTYDKFFPVIDYHPVSSGSNIRGTFKCKFHGNIGSVKFNKIALYCVRYSGGNIITEEPVFFGEAYLNSPVIKSNLTSEGFDDLFADVQIDLGSVAYDFSSVFFASSADYWSRIPNGLYYSERIGVGTFNDGINSPQATIHSRKLSATLPPLRIDYNDNNYADFDVTSIGDLKITLSGTGTSYGDEKYYRINPAVDSKYWLGEVGKSFKGLHLDSQLVGAPLYIYENGSTVMWVGRSLESETYALKIDDYGIKIYEGDREYGYFAGGDLFRDNSSLLVYTTYDGSTNSDGAVGIFAGVNKNYAWPEVDEEYLNHKNLEKSTITDLSFQDGFLNTAKIYMIGKGGINLNGPVILNNNRDSYGLFDLDPVTSLLGSTQSMMFFAGMSTADLDVFDYNAVNNIPLTATLNSTGKLYFAASEIVIDGTIVPMSLDNIGTENKYFGTLRIQNIYNDLYFDLGKVLSYATSFTSQIARLGAIKVVDAYNSTGRQTTLLPESSCKLKIGNASSYVDSIYSTTNVFSTVTAATSVTTPSLTATSNIMLNGYNIGLWSDAKDVNLVAYVNDLVSENVTVSTAETRYMIVGNTVFVRIYVNYSISTPLTGTNVVFGLFNAFRKDTSYTDGSIVDLHSRTISFVDINNNQVVNVVDGTNLYSLSYNIAMDTIYLNCADSSTIPTTTLQYVPLQLTFSLS